MNNAAVLLDKAKKNVSPANYSGLAARLDVSRQSVHRWKTGIEPIPEDRIAQIARIAQQDVGEWVVLLHAERSSGEVRRGLISFLKRAGVGAGLVCFVIALPYFGDADTLAGTLTALPSMHYANWLGLAAAAITAGVWSWRERSPAPVLA